MIYQICTILSRLLPSLGAKSCTGRFKRHFPVYTESLFVFLLLPNKRRVKELLEHTLGGNFIIAALLLSFFFSRRQSVKTEKLPLPLQKLLNNGFSRSDRLHFFHQTISPDGICNIKPPQIGLLRKGDRLVQITGKINKLQRSINKSQAEKKSNSSIPDQLRCYLLPA